MGLLVIYRMHLDLHEVQILWYCNEFISPYAPQKSDERRGGLASGYYAYVNAVIRQGPFLVTDVRLPLSLFSPSLITGLIYVLQALMLKEFELIQTHFI